MTPLCVSLGGGSQVTLTTEPLPCFTVTTVMARGGALGAVEGEREGDRG